MKYLLLGVLGVAMLAGCTDREAQRQAQLAAQAKAQAEAANALAGRYDAAVADGKFEMARAYGADLLQSYPDSEAAKRVKPGYDATKVKASEAAEQRRLQALWQYSQVAADGGVQRSALIYSRDDVDVDGHGAKPVQLVFRDHPKWKRSSYLVLQTGDFRCYGGCKVKVKADDGPVHAMSGYRPKTDEAIAMFINDDKALWKLVRHAKIVSVEFPVKAGGTRTAVFEVGGLDGSQMKGWN